MGSQRRSSIGETLFRTERRIQRQPRKERARHDISQPDGITNMFTIECSYPWAKNVMIGSHIATIFPTVERDTIASTVPIVTIQLHSIPLTNAVANPLAPSAMYPSVFFCAACFSRSPSAPLPEVPQLVTAR